MAALNEALRAALREMFRVDQDLRGRAWETQDDRDLCAELVETGQRNTARMKGIVDEHGWPGRSLAGEDGANAAWLLVQHADADPAFQERCLALMEAAAAGVRLVVTITEGIPIQDMIRVKYFLRQHPAVRLVGPNCPGLLTPGVGKIGIIPQRFASPGPVGIVSRSGTLTYEAMAALTAAGMGQSTIVGIGGDPVLGLTFSDVVRLFEQDSKTTHLALIGEIGGSDEERAAELLGKGSRLKTVAFISGRTAPEGKRMGHAGAIVSGNRGTAKSKEEAFRAAGVAVAETTDQIVELLTKS